MKQYIIAFFLLCLSSSGFAMTTAGKELFYLGEKNDGVVLFASCTIDLLIRGSTAKIIPVSYLHLMFGFKSLDDLVKKKKETGFHITIENDEFQNFIVLLKLIHDIKQDENIAKWELQRLKSLIDLARKFDFNLENESILHFVKHCTQNLSLVEIEILLAELPAEDSIRKAVLDGVRNFSRINFQCFVNLPDNFHKLPFFVVYYILENPQFEVTCEDDFAWAIFIWLAARETPNIPNQPDKKFTFWEKNVIKLFNLFPETEREKNSVSIEHINKLFGLIRYPYLSSKFVNEKLGPFLSPFSGFHPKAKHINDYAFALECSLARDNEAQLKAFATRDKRTDTFMTWRASYKQLKPKK